MYGSHFLGIWTVRFGLEKDRACLRQGALGAAGGLEIHSFDKTDCSSGSLGPSWLYKLPDCSTSRKAKNPGNKMWLGSKSLSAGTVMRGESMLVVGDATELAACFRASMRLSAPAPA